MIITEIAKIVAEVRDAHTSASLPITRSIPFEFYCFPEGVYIVAALLKNKEFLNCRVTHLNEIPMEEVISELKSIISYENESFLKAQLPRYLSSVEALYGLEIIDNMDNVELTIQKVNGEVVNIVIPSNSYNEIQGKLLKDIGLSQVDIPLYRRNIDKNYWSFFVKEKSTLYFNYNRCMDMTEISVRDFCVDLMNFINSNDVKRLVIDIRNNLGGNSTLLDPFISELSKSKKLNREGGIYVILGRETFSSALLNAYSLKYKTKAILIGEPSGGKPNCYGEVKYFRLNNSKIRISYSTEFYKLIRSNKELSLLPDVLIELTIKDYIKNIDPCMVWATTTCEKTNFQPKQS
ncbi:MAG: peptidase family [Clostridiales bacterium]|jgi:hypothetical protein|nr:peptidase family [Clostridiales bacterium]